MSHFTIGPDHGSIRVHTFREGAARKIGHDLIIAVEGWTAAIETDDAGSITALSVDVDPRSLRVLEGLHGMKPLSDKDRDDIRGNIDAKVLRGQPISFSADSVERDDRRLSLSGPLTIAGQSRPTRHDLDIGDGRVTGTITLTQSEWGISPYRAMMGALKVRDAVDVVIDVALPVRRVTARTSLPRVAYAASGPSAALIAASKSRNPNEPSSRPAIVPSLAMVNSHGSVGSLNASSGGRRPLFRSLST